LYVKTVGLILRNSSTSIAVKDRKSIESLAKEIMFTAESELNTFEAEFLLKMSTELDETKRYLEVILSSGGLLSTISRIESYDKK